MALGTRVYSRYAALHIFMFFSLQTLTLTRRLNIESVFCFYTTIFLNNTAVSVHKLLVHRRLTRLLHN